MPCQLEIYQESNALWFSFMVYERYRRFVVASVYQVVAFSGSSYGSLAVLSTVQQLM